ncbi:MAG: hypothetical protein K0S41_2033 [Anaerocolumna sp.]|jgi:hypothetical protein|nr:hypothetical protein [Anaerocolumna sp.]
MKKGFIELNVPESCGTCRFRQIAIDSDLFIDDEPYCVATMASMLNSNPDIKPYWCPIKVIE